MAFDLAAALAHAESEAPACGGRYTELSEPRIVEWLRQLLPRVIAGRISWRTARDILCDACRHEGIPEPRSGAPVIAAYARRKFPELTR